MNTAYYTKILPFSIHKKGPYKFDSNGVIQSKIPYTQKYDYHVTAIASYAIANVENSKIFDAQIKWLIDNIDKNGAYKHDFTFPFYNNFPKPWIGGLAQGLAISALIRADEIKTAEKAFKCLQTKCTRTDNLSYLWIEEYPMDPPASILNGFIYALFGVYDLYKETKNKEAEMLWIKGITTLENNLKYYDLGYWSKYSLLDNLPATGFYHKVHIEQLGVLFNITTKNIFETFSYNWNICLNSNTCQLKAKMKRNFIIIKKHGILRSWKKLQQQKKWKETDNG